MVYNTEKYISISSPCVQMVTDDLGRYIEKIILNNYRNEE